MEAFLEGDKIFPFMAFPAGFQISFPNGYQVSVQWSIGSYCSNKTSKNHGSKSFTAEVAVFKGDAVFPIEEPTGWLNPAEVAALIAKTALRTK